MPRRRTWTGGAVLGLFLIGATADAVITRLTPLREVLAEQQFICVAKVDRLAPDKPAAVLSVAEDLKGKLPYCRLPVNLTGDEEAKKDRHPAALLKRLAPE